MGVKNGTVALGSVKSNIGHLKAAAGAVGILKTTLALFHHTLPPSVNFDKPNPNIDFSNTPFYVNTQTQSWEVNPGEVRRAGISSFGFGGTNFHVVMEEYLPGMLSKTSEVFAIPQPANSQADIPAMQPVSTPMAAAMTSEVVSSNTISAAVDAAAIEKHVLAVVSEKTGYPPEMLDLELDLEADLGVDTVKQAELFAAIRTHYGIPRREDLRLSDYNTLKKVIGFVTDSLAQGNLAVAEEKPIEKSSEGSLVKEVASISQNSEPKPYQGLFFLSANNRNDLKQALISGITEVKAGKIPPSICPPVEHVKKSERIAIDYSDQAELIKRCEKALSALEFRCSKCMAGITGSGYLPWKRKSRKSRIHVPGPGLTVCKYAARSLQNRAGCG